MLVLSRNECEKEDGEEESCGRRWRSAGTYAHQSHTLRIQIISLIFNVEGGCSVLAGSTALTCDALAQPYWQERLVRSAGLVTHPSQRPFVCFTFSFEIIYASQARGKLQINTTRPRLLHWRTQHAKPKRFSKQICVFWSCAGGTDGAVPRLGRGVRGAPSSGGPHDARDRRNTRPSLGERRSCVSRARERADSGTAASSIW